jgi:hypothetical protein
MVTMPGWDDDAVNYRPAANAADGIRNPVWREKSLEYLLTLKLARVYY